MVDIAVQETPWNVPLTYVAVYKIILFRSNISKKDNHLNQPQNNQLHAIQAIWKCMHWKNVCDKYPIVKCLKCLADG